MQQAATRDMLHSVEICFVTSLLQRPSRRTGGGFMKSGVRFCMIKALHLLNADYPLLPTASSFATKMGDVFVIDT